MNNRADVIAERIAKSSASDDLVTKEFVRVEIAALRGDLHKEMSLLPRRIAGMLLLQTGLVATLTKLL